MILNKTISLIMPSRNVEQIVEKQLDLIPQFFDEVIIISNNSKDKTFEKCKEYAKNHPRYKVFEDNRVDQNGIGYGFAIQTGFANSTSDYSFKADFDGTYPVEKFEEFVINMENREGLFAIGSRYPVQEGSHVKLFNSVGVWVLNTVNKVVNGVSFDDILCGMYGGKTSLIKELKCTEGGWNYSIEFKLKAAKMFKKQVLQFHINQQEQMTKSNQKYLQTGFTHLSYLLGV